MITKQRIRKIAINTAKLGLTIASPPLGGASFGKTEQGRGYGLIGGTIASMLISSWLMALAIIEIPEKVYDDPYVSINRYPNSVAISTLESIFSPLALYFSNHKETVIATEEGERLIRVYGDDVITFDQETGKYILNFSNDRKFRISEGNDRKSRIPEGKLVSVTEAQNEVDRLAQKQRRLESEGNILEVREVNANLQKADESYANILSGYNSARSVYLDAVEKMNSELEGIVDSKTIIKIEKSTLNLITPHQFPN